MGLLTCLASKSSNNQEVTASNTPETQQPRSVELADPPREQSREETAHDTRHRYLPQALSVRLRSHFSSIRRRSLQPTSNREQRSLFSRLSVRRHSGAIYAPVTANEGENSLASERAYDSDAHVIGTPRHFARSLASVWTSPSKSRFFSRAAVPRRDVRDVAEHMQAVADLAAEPIMVPLLPNRTPWNSPAMSYVPNTEGESQQRPLASAARTRGRVLSDHVLACPSEISLPAPVETLSNPDNVAVSDRDPFPPNEASLPSTSSLSVNISDSIWSCTTAVSPSKQREASSDQRPMWPLTPDDSSEIRMSPASDMRIVPEKRPSGFQGSSSERRSTRGHRHEDDQGPCSECPVNLPVSSCSDPATNGSRTVGTPISGGTLDDQLPSCKNDERTELRQYLNIPESSESLFHGSRRTPRTDQSACSDNIERSRDESSVTAPVPLPARTTDAMRGQGDGIFIVPIRSQDTEGIDLDKCSAKAFHGSIESNRASLDSLGSLHNARFGWMSGGRRVGYGYELVSDEEESPSSGSDELGLWEAEVDDGFMVTHAARMLAQSPDVVDEESEQVSADFVAPDTDASRGHSRRWSPASSFLRFLGRVRPVDRHEHHVREHAKQSPRQAIPAKQTAGSAGQCLSESITLGRGAASPTISGDVTDGGKEAIVVKAAEGGSS